MHEAATCWKCSVQTRRKRSGKLNLPSSLQETDVLIGAAQEDIKTQVKGR